MMQVNYIQKPVFSLSGPQTPLSSSCLALTWAFSCFPTRGDAWCCMSLFPPETQLRNHGCSISVITQEVLAPMNSVHSLLSSRKETTFLSSFSSGWKVSMETFVVPQCQFSRPTSFEREFVDAVWFPGALSEWMAYVARPSQGVYLVPLFLWCAEHQVISALQALLQLSKLWPRIFGAASRLYG